MNLELSIVKTKKTGASPASLTVLNLGKAKIAISEEQADEIIAANELRPAGSQATEHHLLDFYYF